MSSSGAAPGQSPAEHIDNETTPLLTNGSVAPTADPVSADALSKDDSDSNKPLPKGQVLLLSYARMVETIAFFGIFPFVNQMVQRNGSLPESEVGFYSGLIESLFSLTQMIVMIFWGRVSDRVGRKPVLVTSLIGMTIMTAAFGFATTIWQMILFRCLGGMFAGTVVTIRVMISELSTPKTQARAFSFFMVASNLGILVGPLIGGTLADPAGQYGGVFGRVKFFEQFPYALPTLVMGVNSLIATIVAAFFINETLTTRQSDKSGNTNAKSNEAMSMWQLIKYPGVGIVLYLYTHVMLLAYAYTAVVPVFWFTSVSLGGFSFSPFQISLFISLVGASQGLWTLLVFPPVQQRYGTAWLLRACSIAYPVFFCFNPLLNVLLRHADANNVQWEKTLFWVLGPILVCIGSAVSMSFTGVQLALNDVCPSPIMLGTLNGLALSAASGVRAFSPALFTSIFAVGVKKRILGGYLAWFVLIILALMLIVITRNLPAKVEAHPTRDEDATEQDSERRTA